MKSNEFRIISTDKQTKENYRFDSDKFAKALTRCSRASKSTGKHIYIKDYMEMIADRAGVSVDAVKKWKSGHNGPSSIEMVEAIADILNIDYKGILSPEKNETREETSVNEDDKKLIRHIFEKIHDIIQMKVDLPETPGKIMNMEEYRKLMWKEHQEVRKLENEVYKASLYTSENTRNTLLKILSEVNEIVDDYIPVRWEEIEIHSEKIDENYIQPSNEESMIYYIRHDTREEVVEHYGIEYLLDEICYAESLGFTGINYMDDDFLDENIGRDWGHFSRNGKDISVEEMCKYGCTEIDIEPAQVYLFMLSHMIALVFKNDFNTNDF